MRARYYSPDLKRFVNQDVLLGAITNSQSLNRYAYTNGNPINRLDPFGLCAAMLKNLGHLALNLLATILLFTPFAPVGAVLAGINAAWYFYDGDILGGLCSLGIVLGGVGSLIGGTAGLIMSGCGNLLLAGTSTWSAGQSIGKMYMDYQETGTINPWDAVSATMNLGMAVMGGYGAFKSFSSIPAMGQINSKLESAWNARKSGGSGEAFDSIKGKGAYNGEVASGEGFGKLADKEINVTQKGLDRVKNNISSNRFDCEENSGMISRIENALNKGEKITGADASYYMHELKESSLMSTGYHMKTHIM